jgi:transposase-like protein/IS1 family transposase
MDPTKVFCPNEACPARGQAGKGNIGVHSRKEGRYRCRECGRTFSETTGSAFFGLRSERQVVIWVVTLLAYGCPVQACVAAFGLDERTIAAWRQRAGLHSEALHHHLVTQPRDLGQVQADELYVKHQKGKLWMAMALMVSTRLWLGGVISPERKLKLMVRLMEMVKACAVRTTLIICTDGLRSYIRAVGQVFREPVVTGQLGRPRLVRWRDLGLGQMVKQYAGGRVVGVVQRVFFQTATFLTTHLYLNQGRGAITTVYIERLNATFRQRLGCLVRRTRTLARQLPTMHTGMFLIGTVYNFCTVHESLSLPQPDLPSRSTPRTPAMAAGLTDHVWSLAELLSFRVPPPPWKPPKRRGRPSQTLKKTIEKWCPTTTL